MREFSVVIYARSEGEPFLENQLAVTATGRTNLVYSWTESDGTEKRLHIILPVKVPTAQITASILIKEEGDLR